MKQGLSTYVRKHRYSFLIVALVAILLVVVFSILPFSNKSSIVSHQELTSYFQEYLSQYSMLVEENMALLDKGIVEGYSNSGSQNLTFYWRRPYQIEGIISRTHGAALFFNHSDTETVKITDFSKPIEYYVWPTMVENSTGLPSIRIMKTKGYYHFDTQMKGDGVLIYVDPGANMIYTDQGHLFSFSGNGAVIIFGSLIEENTMILKGSNSKEDWSELQARFDSLSKFLWDCQGILNETSIEGLDAKYRLPLLLEKISLKMESGAYRDNPALFTEDYEELKTVCSSNETLSRILRDYYEMQTRASPTWIDQLLAVWNLYMVPIVTGIVVGIILIYYELRISRTKKRGITKEKKKGDDRHP